MRFVVGPQAFTGAYDANGNLTTIQDYVASETLNYSYDVLDRLTGVSGAYSQSYDYNATTGNLENKAGQTLAYADINHPHAATGMGSNAYSYDENGNMISRQISSGTYILSYDAGGQLVGISGGGMSAAYTYNGDGERVKVDITMSGDTKTSAYIGNYFEVSVGDPIQPQTVTPPNCSISICLYLPLVMTASRAIPAGHAWTSYYSVNGRRVAMRVQSNQDGVAEGVYYFLSDHLGSTTVTLDHSGNLIGELRYSAWGETRYTSGTTPTQRRYTGQLQAEAGLYFYNARWFDGSLGRFVQADTFIPQMANAQSWDRFAYVNNSPLMYTDPSGHWMCDIYDPGCVENAQDMAEYGIMVYESGLLGNNPGSSNPTDAVNDLWSNDVHASGNLLRFTVGWEDFSAKPYEDSNGYCTVGFGHNCADEDLTKYSSYTYMDFWDLFLGDLKNAEAGVRKAFQDLDNQYFSNINGYTLGNYVPINQAEFDALVDFSFNAGEGTVYDLIGKNLVSENTAGVPVKNIAGFENALRVDYTGGGGIQIRRGQEIEIFLHQNYYHSH